MADKQSIYSLPDSNGSYSIHTTTRTNTLINTHNLYCLTWRKLQSLCIKQKREQLNGLVIPKWCMTVPSSQNVPKYPQQRQQLIIIQKLGQIGPI